jgi:hypothetical protein
LRLEALAAVLVLAFAAVACGDDIGSPCTLKGELREDRDLLILQFSPIHPCDSQLCLGKRGEGRDGYCTAECSGEGRGSCPGHFTCSVVDEISVDFRGRRFCVRDEDAPDAAIFR